MLGVWNDRAVTSVDTRLEPGELDERAELDSDTWERVEVSLSPVMPALDEDTRSALRAASRCFLTTTFVCLDFVLCGLLPAVVVVVVVVDVDVALAVLSDTPLAASTPATRKSALGVPNPVTRS